MKTTLDKILIWLLALSLPFLLLMTAVRVVLLPQFAQLEYHRPGFPEDPYGFTREDRLKWSDYAITYLTNDEDIAYLGNLTFEDGSSLFAPSELEHMVDVKGVVRTALYVWYGIIGLTLGVAVWFLSMNAWKKFRKGWLTGGWLTIGLILAVLTMLVLSFDSLFEQFHRLFFSEGSWLFYANDTLIRLFPLDFWRDAFIVVLGLTLLLAVLILLFTREKRKKTKAVKA